MSLFVVFMLSILSFGESLQEDVKDDITKRVVGGKSAQEGQYPWTVALYRQGEYICSGSIISNTSILTAAHCVVIDGETVSPRDLHAIAGVANRSSPDGTFIEFRDIAVHPWYNKESSDIAILETAAPIELGGRVQQICIANEKMGPLILKRVMAMGWGQTNRDVENPDLPDILQFSPQRIVSNLKCLLLFLGNRVPPNVVCATGKRSGICNGDSGGPLVYFARKRPIQVGVASYVNGVSGCGHLYGPAAFTRLSSFTAYLKKTATGDVCVA